MKQCEIKKILDTLKLANLEGIGLFSLSNKTGVKPSSLRKFIETHKEYCVQYPNTQLFGINRFGKFKGNVSEMVGHYGEEIEQKRKNRQLYCYFSGSFPQILVITILLFL